MHENSAPVALVCAMESELVHALEAIDEQSSFALGPWRAVRGMLAGLPVVALAAGIGLVNAAAATSVLIANERPRAVFNFGCAGGHHEQINPGDVIIGAEVVACGSLITLPDGSERYAGYRYGRGKQTVLTDIIRADRHLLKLARSCADSWVPKSWPIESPGNREAVIHVGVIASADCWTQDPRRIGMLHDRHRSLCEEMEAAAVAQVCTVYDVPMLAIKDISNNELHALTEHGEDGPTLAEVSCELGARSFALVAEVVSRMNRS
ncbi:MAG TPA: 5'-methylthioadenosine/S-adenosylhomocysteine nucleosidase [Nitrolancea sp.]|jgi:adenosylhomocysteine nucleosidase|nr:5'-methylthioadenosine/S-adenosylhomocysteine nucleosidase [Nitrolancea sp.]